MSDEPQFPIEPLSERRWNEIRRKVLSQSALIGTAPSASADRSSRRVVAGALVAAAAAVVLVWFTQASSIPATNLSRAVTDDSSATVSAGDATVTLAAHTSVLVIERESDAWLVSLEYGEARFDVPPRGQRPAFSVEAGRTRIQVVGTAFTVTREPGATTASVRVDHGAVRVTEANADALLRDGEVWPEPTRIETVQVATAQPEIAQPATPADVAPPTEAPSRVVVPRATTAPVVSSARDRYRAAESQEASDPTGALAVYAALVREGGPWSAPALMSQAHLEAELGHRDRARDLAQRYLVEHPDGLNAQDARVLLERLR